jgi:hypothetical protein
MQVPTYNSGEHSRKLAGEVCRQQGGTYPESGSKGPMPGEVFDKNRGTDKGGSNAPTSTNAK